MAKSNPSNQRPASTPQSVSPSPSGTSDPKASDEQPSLTDLAGGASKPLPDAPPLAPAASPGDAPSPASTEPVDGESGDQPPAAPLAPPPVSASLAAAAAGQTTEPAAPAPGTPFNFQAAAMLSSTAKAEAEAAAAASAAPAPVAPAPKAPAAERDPTTLPVHELTPAELEDERLRLVAYRDAIRIANDRWAQFRADAETSAREFEKLIQEAWVARKAAEDNFQPVHVSGRLSRIEDLIASAAVPPVPPRTR